MRIRNLQRSSPFVFTSSVALATVEASSPDALNSNTLAVLRMKSFTESFNPTPTPTPVVLNQHHQYVNLQSNLPTSNPNRAGMAEANDNADDGSDSAELMQTPSFPAIPNKEEVQEMEKLRVCTVNKSPWDVPSFVRAFLTKPTTEPAEQSMQSNRCKRNNKKKKINGPLIPNLASHTKSTAEAKQQVRVEDDDDFNKTEIARLVYKRKAAMNTNTLPCGKEMLQVAEEDQMLESALVRVFSEETAGLTVREAGCKLMLRNVNNIISEGLPLSVQVRRAMLNSPYFVQMEDGKFSLWDNFLNSSVGRLDEEEITSAEIDKRMGIHKFDRQEDCASYKEPAKETSQSAETNLELAVYPPSYKEPAKEKSQSAETNLELAVPKIMRTKRKRSRRAGLDLGLVMNLRVRDEEREETGICRQEDGKRRNSCWQEVEQRSYNSVYSGNNGGSNDYNNYSWDKDAVVASDSQCYYSQILSDGNGETSQNGIPPSEERYRAASGLISCVTRSIGIEKELRPPCYRKRKPVKARSLKALL